MGWLSERLLDDETGVDVFDDAEEDVFTGELLLVPAVVVNDVFMKGIILKRVLGLSELASNIDCPDVLVPDDDDDDDDDDNDDVAFTASLSSFMFLRHIGHVAC